MTYRLKNNRLMKSDVREEVIGKEDAVVVHMGGNDIEKFRSEEVMRKYQEMMEVLKGKVSRVLVNGILPRKCQSGEWHSRAMGINNRVRELCRKLGFEFVSLWQIFINKPKLYALDGVHL